jgi:DNA mismatch repair protein MutS2
MNAHALAVLEFPRVLALVAERASSDLGAERVRSLSPSPSAERDALEKEHARVAAVGALVASESGWSPEPIPALAGPLRRLRIAGTSWNGPELLLGATLLRSARRTQDALRDPKRPAVVSALLAVYANRMVVAKEEEGEIARAIADDGSVRDEASPTLRRLRREMRAAEGELLRILERVVRSLPPEAVVQDMSVTVREGRFVVPVRRDARLDLGGIVHGTSATGATLFVEPPAAIEFGNRMRELEAEEAREIDRILLELTERLRPLAEAMADALDALVALDALYARARYAREFRCEPATLVPSREGFAIRDGRHPLLLAQGAPVVPFDLAMTPEERTLLVSGPNTGGKTVLLKAIALLSALMQSGIPAPVGAESRVPMFDDLFADIGDEQSIQASLSTFSAHLKNLAEILRSATADSLVLVDELGSGTDPLEGAALGGAILEELTRRRTLTIATTHLGALKELATEVPGVVNASLQFDAAALAPTYRLVKGVPGRSYGLSIARRLALPEQVLARAEERVPKGERDVERLLADLEARDAALAARERETEAMAEEAQARAAKLASRERAVRDRERAAERESRKEARRFVLDARAEIERTIRELKAAGADQIDEAGKAARQRAEALAESQAEHLDRLEREERNVAAREATRERARPAASLEVGDVVAVATLGGRTGRLVEKRDGQATVAFGAMKMSVPVAALTLSRSRDEIRETTVVLRGDIPEVDVRSEIDLRGHRVDEIDAPLLSALDAAIRADLKALRVIHGKGTGALRDRVAELLRKDTRVRNFRLGAWNEGGAGVTVVEL